MNNIATKLNIKNLTDIHNDPCGEVKVLEGTSDSENDTLYVDVSTLSCPDYTITFNRICRKLKKSQHKNVVLITTAPSIGDQMTQRMLSQRLGNFKVAENNIAFKRDSKEVEIDNDNPVYVRFVA